jgi:transcription elongation GreA/GreB family factor
MTSDPLSAALKEISEARHLLESLLTASENFEYHRAKAVLKKLNRKVRDLARLQSEYQQVEKSRVPNLCVLNFQPPSPPVGRVPSPAAPTRSGATGS